VDGGAVSGFEYSGDIEIVWVGHTSTQVLQAMHRWRITVWVLASLSVMMALVGQLRSHLRQKMHFDMS
jgi:hypothetical protein